MVWMDRGLLQSRPYLRGTKLTFQGGQEGNVGHLQLFSVSDHYKVVVNVHVQVFV